MHRPVIHGPNIHRALKIPVHALDLKELPVTKHDVCNEQVKTNPYRLLRSLQSAESRGVT